MFKAPSTKEIDRSPNCWQREWLAGRTRKKGEGTFRDVRKGNFRFDRGVPHIILATGPFY